MIGMRNRVAHVYFDVDLDVVWVAVKHHLPALERYLAGVRELSPAIHRNRVPTGLPSRRSWAFHSPCVGRSLRMLRRRYRDLALGERGVDLEKLRRFYAEPAPFAHYAALALTAVFTSVVVCNSGSRAKSSETQSANTRTLRGRCRLRAYMMEIGRTGEQ
jgi:hypothetical protein